VLPPVVVRPYVFTLAQRPAVAASSEVRESFWVSLDAFTAPGVYRDVTVTPHGLELVVPAYVLGARTVWGMTERILTPLLRLLGGPAT
jgi:hypothetical protein